jgi:hypothetical protein
MSCNSFDSRNGGRGKVFSDTREGGLWSDSETFAGDLPAAGGDISGCGYARIVAERNGTVRLRCILKRLAGLIEPGCGVIVGTGGPTTLCIR